MPDRLAQPATDALWIYDRTDCMAARLVVGTGGASGGIVWRNTGALESCVEELLALPGPGEPAAPRLMKAGALLFALCRYLWLVDEGGAYQRLAEPLHTLGTEVISTLPR